MAPKKKKRAHPANTEIVREQIQLVKAEKELKKTLENINEQINKLLVSLKISHFFPTMDTFMSSF